MSGGEAVKAGGGVEGDHPVCTKSSSAGADGEGASKRLIALAARARGALAATHDDAGDSSRRPLSLLARHEADRLVRARRLRIDGMAPDRPVFTVVRARTPPPRFTWAFRLPVADADDHLIFETIAAISAPVGTTTSTIEQAASVVHQRLLDVVRSAVDPWRQTMLRREDAIAETLRASHARLAAALLQPRLFDGRIQRAADAQAVVTEAALRQSHARRAALVRLSALRGDVRTVVFGIGFRR